MGCKTKQSEQCLWCIYSFVSLQCNSEILNNSFSLGIISEYFSVVIHYSGMGEMSSIVSDIWILSPQLAVPLGGLEVRMSLAEGRMALCQALLVYNLSPFQVHSLFVFFFLFNIVLSVGLPFPCLPTAQLPSTDGDGLLSLWSHTGKHILLP